MGVIRDQGNGRGDNWRIADETISELYFEGELVPGMGALSAGATFSNASAQAAVVDLPVNGLWRVMVRRKRRWKKCGMRWHVYYTSDGAAGGNYSLTMTTCPQTEGDTLGAIALGLNVTMTLPAPAGAGDIMLYEGVDTAGTAVPGSKPIVRFALLRNAGNANALRVLSVHYELLPQG